MAKLRIVDLVKEYPTRSEPLRVLRGVSFELDSGRNMAIVGPSGSGKSTLLSILGTLESPTGGTMRLGDVDPFVLGASSLAAFRRERIGFVFQDHHLLPQCSVLENVLMPTLAVGRTTVVQRARALQLLDRVGLSQRLEHRPAELSGGERQRAALCRALILKPSLLLADEPTGNLDRATSSEIAALLLDLQREEGMMLIIVTHSQHVASRMDRVLELDEGLLKAV